MLLMSIPIHRRLDRWRCNDSLALRHRWRVQISCICQTCKPPPLLCLLNTVLPHNWGPSSSLVMLQMPVCSDLPLHLHIQEMLACILDTQCSSRGGYACSLCSSNPRSTNCSVSHVQPKRVPLPCPPGSSAFPLGRRDDVGCLANHYLSKLAAVYNKCCTMTSTPILFSCIAVCWRLQA